MEILCLILILCSELVIQNGIHAKVIRTAELNVGGFEEDVKDNQESQEYKIKQAKAEMNLNITVSETLMSTTPDWNLNVTVSPTLLSTIRECDCGPYTKECRMVGYRKECVCQEGYSSNFETCEKCDCGIYSKDCSFRWYMKMCDCLEGYIERNGTCTERNPSIFSTSTEPTPLMSTTPECDCGFYTKECRMVGDTKECICQEGYSLNSETCEKCNCGRFSKNCTFSWYGKYCDCLEGYIDRNGTCTKCDCGKNSKRCRFNTNTYKKECICKPDYSERLGTCVECDCGINTKSCKFDSYRKQCECRNGYSPLNDICKECDCGKHSKSCSFSWYGKVCECETGYANNNGTCSECDCGENSRRCSFFSNGTKWCTCNSNYAQNNGTCSALCYGPSDCANGTICTKGEGDRHFCECPPNFKGKMCEINVLCEEIEHMCQAMAAVCVLKNSRAYCECPLGKKVDLQSGLCTDICDPDICVHGTCEVVGLNYRCKCAEGYTGIHCDKVAKTKSNNSILWMVALISVNTLICVVLFAIFCLLCCKKK